ncbi:MAG: TIGR03936 family radical SAM-associated protein [Clostridiaceae bacterium]|jgi:radical SAM-linked protein|nr:TIGR03936 family radical SAM-associated protein [Clostridiaceae bacterium]
MIILKYRKTGSARYISHIDVLRGMGRILRRAGLEPTFSQGFNPHMNLYFSPPIALGLGSVAEYMAVDIPEVSPEDFLKKYNAAAPDGLKGISAEYAEKNPNFAANVKAFVYRTELKGSAEALAKIEKIKDVYNITYTQKGETVTKDVGALIRKIERRGDSEFFFTLAAGAEVLRPDRLLKQLEVDFGIEYSLPEVTKTEQLFGVDNPR